MTYVIEVIYDNPGGKSPGRRSAQLQELKTAGKLSHQEHFTLSEEIRDTNYRAVSLLKFENVSEATGFADGHVPERSARVICELEISIGNFERTDRNDVFLVNPFEISQAQVPEVLDMWHKAKGHMIENEGFVNARLFCSSRLKDRYGLVNISQWTSAEKFKQALGDKAYDKHRERSLNYKLHPSLCVRQHMLETA